MKYLNINVTEEDIDRKPDIIRIYDGESGKSIEYEHIRPKGKWTTKRGSMIMTCTNCEKDTWYSGRNDYIFCPNCGAKMIESVDV